MNFSAQERRKKRVSAKIRQGKRGRKIVVFRSNRYIVAQVVDIFSGKTLVGVSSKTVTGKKKLTKTEAAYLTGQKLAQKAIKMGVKKVAFDRRHYRYHGRVKAVAEGARAGGLRF